MKNETAEILSHVYKYISFLKLYFEVKRQNNRKALNCMKKNFLVILWGQKILFHRILSIYSYISKTFEIHFIPFIYKWHIFGHLP